MICLENGVENEARRKDKRRGRGIRRGRVGRGEGGVETKTAVEEGFFNAENGVGVE